MPDMRMVRFQYLYVWIACINAYSFISMLSVWSIHAFGSLLYVLFVPYVPFVAIDKTLHKHDYLAT